MAYTTIDNPELYFQPKLWTGTGGSNTLTLDGSENMQPDWVWIKDRQDTHLHNLFDSVRGVTKRIHSDTTDAESTHAESLKSFDSDGFTLGTQTNVNQSSHTNVSWNWKAGTSFSNDASATSVGTIDSSGSVSTDAGFSIVIRTGTGSAGTIKHGLSTVPTMIITKMRNDTESWGVYHVGVGNTKYFKSDTNEVADTSSGVWNDTTPTTSVYSVGNSALVNGSSKTYVDYIFSEVKGYSKFGSYTGNGNADGTFVYTGFKPAWFMLKRTNGSNGWAMFDNKRDPENSVDKLLFAHLSNAEQPEDTYHFDFLSNGFKIRDTDADWNASGGTYIYMAFAESPFVNSNGVPNNAR